MFRRAETAARGLFMAGIAVGRATGRPFSMEGGS